MKNSLSEIKLIQISSELGAGTRGSSKGIDGLLKASVDKGSGVFQDYELITVPHSNHALLEPIRYQYAKRITELHAVFQRVSNSLKFVLSEVNTFPIVLAGDHSSAAGTIAGIKASYPNKRVGVVWVDAHADIHTPYTTPSGNMHGMPLAASLGIDHVLPKSNQPNAEVKGLWERVKCMEGISPKIKPEDLVFVGVRDTEWQEDKLIKELGIQRYSVDFVRENGGKQTGQSVLKRLINADVIYISYDVDVLDSGISVGTGTPVQNGLYLSEVKQLISTLIQSTKVVCFEIVEINPSLDNTENKMAEMGLEVIEMVIDGVKRRA